MWTISNFTLARRGRAVFRSSLNAVDLTLPLGESSLALPVGGRRTVSTPSPTLSGPDSPALPEGEYYPYVGPPQGITLVRNGG